MTACMFFILFQKDKQVCGIVNTHIFYFSVRTGHIRNLESARVSMVGQLKKYVPVCTYFQLGCVKMFNLTHDLFLEKNSSCCLG